MSQHGSIVDYRINIKPSEKLLTFISKISIENKENIPRNIFNILKSFGVKLNIEDYNEIIGLDAFSKEENDIIDSVKLDLSDFESTLSFLNVETNDNNVNVNEDDQKESDYNTSSTSAKRNASENAKNDDKKSKELNILELNDLKWINRYLVNDRKSNNPKVYLHEILEGSTLVLPKNEVIIRNPDLEARCQKLREEQANRVYRSMTKDVDSVRRTMPEDTISYQIKSMNSQIIAVLQFVFSVAAGFTFGFLGVELIIGNLDFGFRLLLGIICALIVALAEIYFLAKKLNELDDLKDDITPSPKRKQD